VRSLGVVVIAGIIPVSGAFVNPSNSQYGDMV